MASSEPRARREGIRTSASLGSSMASRPRPRRFHISREAAFWILAAAAMVVLGIVLDLLWGSV